MPFFTIPDKGFDLFYRLSTPSKRDQAIEVDEEYETILFFHPYWIDSFYFYPQFDDPALYENYNLIAFDAPAHGSTKVKQISSDPVTWTFFAGLVREALISLNVSSVHLVGSTMGCCPAMHFASKYPEMTNTLVMSAPPAVQEAANWSLTFRECMHMLINAVKIRDPEPLDAITSVIFDYNATSQSGKIIKNLEKEYAQMIKSKLLSGEFNGEITVPILISLALSRKQILTLEEAVEIDIPVLIIQGTDEGWEEADDQWGKMLEEKYDIYLERFGKSCNTKRIILDGLPRWMTLTSSETLNPIIKEFITSRSVPNPSELGINLEIDAQTSTITTIKTIPKGGRRLSMNKVKKPLSPRDKIEFNIQSNPPPPIRNGYKSVGEVMDELHQSSLNSKEDIGGENAYRHRNGSIDGQGVKIEVEVVMKVE